VNFSDALLGVLAQRLMRTLCASCKEPYVPDQRDIDHLIHDFGPEDWEREGLPREQWAFHRKVGCDACGGSGYRGRTGVHELLRGTREIQKMIYNEAELSEIREQAVKDGMLTLKQDGILKIFKGFSDYQQLLRITGE
jgi:type II secretory ATPase GspE/PulE/Tfp pilus assembly ATPase PilB-like protein